MSRHGAPVMRYVKLLLVVLTGLGLIVAIWRGIEWRHERAFELANQMPPGQEPAVKLDQDVQSIRQAIITQDQTTWAKELLAEEYEESIVTLWDELRAARAKFDVLKRHPFSTILVPSPGSHRPRSLGVNEVSFAPDTRTMTYKEFMELVDLWKAAGYELVQSEWYHESFDPPSTGAARSIFSFELHVANHERHQRVRIEGDLGIEWGLAKDAQDRFPPDKLTVQRLNLTERTGPPAFEDWTGGAGLPMAFGGGPLIVYDLNGDGLSEIALPAENLLYVNQGKGVFTPQPLCAHPVTDPTSQEQRVRAALIADLTGDGLPDLVMAGNKIGIVMFRGDQDGKFTGNAEVILKPTATFVSPQAITAGDINGDHLPDLWISQLKSAAELGAQPTPFWDANDGYLSYLFINMGDGKFKDATIGSGLEAKRYRRTYASSFVDLNGDGSLDLLNSSDFSGVDVHLNDGKGHFTDATDTLLDEHHMFGMGHTFADFDHDGRLDFYVTGMDLATVRRLDYMGLARPEFPNHTKMRSIMAYGSRMFLGQSTGGYRQPPFNDLVARPHWAWGCAAFDLANSGNMDLYIANGHISRGTAKTYTPRTWTQEIYLGNSSASLALQTILNDPDLFPGHRLSFEGYQHNALFVNEGKRGFRNDGFLMDVAFEYDARSVVADDLDGDGLVDLLVTSIDFTRPGKTYGGALHIYHNVLPATNNWIGIRIPDESGNSALGAKIKVTSPAGTNVAQLVTGDSFSAQHPNSKHFGLGVVDRVDSIEVRWQSGRVTNLRNPAINQYHTVRITDTH